jgi:hypothetical protein
MLPLILSAPEISQLDFNLLKETVFTPDVLNGTLVDYSTFLGTFRGTPTVSLEETCSIGQGFKPLSCTLFFMNVIYILIMNILLIDSKVNDYQVIVNACNANTLPIVYSYNFTRDEISKCFSYIYIVNILHNYFT